MKTYAATLLAATVAAIALVGCSQPAEPPEAAAVELAPDAPIFASDMDTDGRPLPFGRRPYQSPDTPLGSGDYRAIMRTDEGLPAHVIYHPADLDAAGKLPIVAWGNGACINAGNRFRDFLTEIASHGYLVAANGIMAPQDLEVGPQENPPVRGPDSPPPPPRDPNAPAPQPRVAGTTTPEQLIESIDWAIAENARPDSPLYDRIDTERVAVMGQSCGGVQALNVAGDPRIDTMMIWHSAAGMIPNNPADPAAVLATIHTPIAYIYGEAAQEIAHTSATQNVEAINHVPVFGAWQDGMTHLGTYGQENGGFFGRLAVDWLDWQLKGDEEAAATFRGEDCLLCRTPSWHVTKKGVD